MNFQDQARLITPRHFLFLLLPEFSLMPFSSAIEPLRIANRMEGTALYSWQTASLDGAPVTSSCGAAVHCDHALSAAPKCDALVICAGLNAARYCSTAAISRVRQAGLYSDMLGSVCTGSLLLAKSGLLDGYRCTIHWEEAESLAENYPALDVTSNLYEIDRNRFTCSGGTAPIDLMMAFIQKAGGRDLAARVADQMVHHSARQASAPQRLALAERTGVRHAKLLDALSLMEAHLETPLALADIAAQTQLSLRQMERLFADHLKASPARFYLNLRLQRARQLVLQTNMPLIQIAVSTGFVSAGHFTKCYRGLFGQAPSADRKTSNYDALIRATPALVRT